MSYGNARKLCLGSTEVDEKSIKGTLRTFYLDCSIKVHGVTIITDLSVDSCSALLEDH